jgi:hypothetical protein
LSVELLATLFLLPRDIAIKVIKSFTELVASWSAFLLLTIGVLFACSRLLRRPRTRDIYMSLGSRVTYANNLVEFFKNHVDLVSTGSTLG